MDMGRTVVNVIGVSLASVVMAKNEGVFDYSRATNPLQPLLEDIESTSEDLDKAPSLKEALQINFHS